MNMRNGERRKVTPEGTYSNDQPNSATPLATNMSPFGSPAPKSIAFELLFSNSPQFRSRLPLRVMIHAHDTTESIVTTVKNFYGLYNGPAGTKGVSFEDNHGNTIIARYENLTHNMVVHVRVIEETASGNGGYDASSYHTGPPVAQQAYYPDMPPPQPSQMLSYGQTPSRPHSRTSHKRSVSPNQGRGRRSASASLNPPIKKNRSRSGFKSRGSSTHGSFAEHSDGLTGYSSGDGGPGSVSSSRTKSEHIGNTEISLDNIVEGGRRKRAKFESSELPLFAPPQMPAATSNSSVSPARRMEFQRTPFMFSNPSQHPFSNLHPLQSPQSYGSGFGQPDMYTTPAGQGRRTRTGASYPPSRQSFGSTPNGNSSGLMPTPDPTVGSCMSEEDKDVALQLMRLGEMSNISHGRTSASTLDDTFSRGADAESSTGATSEEEIEDELPPLRRQKREPSPIMPPGAIKRFRPHLDDVLPSQDSTEHSGDEGEYEDGHDETFRPTLQDGNTELDGKPTIPKTKTLPTVMGKPRISASGMKVQSNKTRTHRPGQVKPKKSASVSGTSTKPISPTSMPPQSRKSSNASALNFQHQLGEDEEDLSSKPRCQRCRKSKKGCDRQRPCQRCKDAGLSADQCVSEDEGNGRKGRYGRHMGVSVKKDELGAETSIILPGYMAGGQGSPDKSKKRKR